MEGAIPAGTNLIGKVSIDQVTADANKVVTTTGSITTATLGAGTAIAGKVGIDQTTDGTTNKVYVGNTANVQLTGSNAATYESLTVADSAIGFTAGTYGTNIYATISCEIAQIRFRVDGTNPTISEGHILNPDDILKLDSLADITAFRAIRTGSISGTLKATFSGVA